MLYELDADWMHTGSPAHALRSTFSRGAGEVPETGVGQDRGGFAGLGVPSRRPSTPLRPCNRSDTPFCPLRAQAGLGDGARGARGRQLEGVSRSTGACAAAAAVVSILI